MSVRLQKVPNEKYLYNNPDTGVYFLRKRTDSEDTDVSLKTTKVRKACELRDAWVHSRTNIKLGITPQPKKQAKVEDISTIIERYEKAGYLTKKGRPHGERQLRCEKDACVRLKKFFKKRPYTDLDQDLLDQYHEWRVDNIKQGEGHRTTDMELTVLSNALAWSKRKKKIDHNPIAERDKYHSFKDSRHAKSCCPTDAEELHETAKIFFSDPRSEVLGWQMLFEASSSLRTRETVCLGMNAEKGDPGQITGESMLVKRGKKGDGTDNAYIHIHAEIKILLEAHKAWHEQRYPLSKFMFPGRSRDSMCHVSEQALAKGLLRLHEDGTIRKFTSHGMRAYYVLVRRSWGIPDTQIAAEINHTGGVEALRISYGVIPPAWLEGKGPKITWLPKDPSKYAWLAIKQKPV
jgi:hypothetical protein